MNLETPIAWRRNLCCEECSTRLAIFRKKKICYFCKNSFCSVCIVRREDKTLCCRKCQILTARPLDKSKLLNLRSRDLINYLTSRQIPTNGCVEKEDLVNVLIKAVNNSCFHPSSTACIDESTNSYSNSDRSDSHSGVGISQWTQNLENDGIRIIGHDSVHDSAENELNGGHSSHSSHSSHFQSENYVNESVSNEGEEFPGVDFSETERERERERRRSERLSRSDGDKSDRTNGHTSNFPPEPLENSPSHPHGDHFPHDFSHGKPLMLSDIKSKSDLEALSVKQLKELLMRNRTDFKGCVEREELIQKANRLWNDYTLSRKDLENLSLEELCKICMDAPIECVLLECGHMATCTSCGKQLCECPICRQFVVRCVRIFKA